MHRVTPLIKISTDRKARKSSRRSRRYTQMIFFVWICVICGQYWVGGRIEYPVSRIADRVGGGQGFPSALRRATKALWRWEMRFFSSSLISP